MAANLLHRLKLRGLFILNNRRARKLAQHVKEIAASPVEGKPVVFFNASTRLGGVSQNAAFAFLSSCALQLAGAPVAHFACDAGMTRCQLGTDPDDVLKEPPCKICAAQGRALTSNAPTRWLTYKRDYALETSLNTLNLTELSAFHYPLEQSTGGAELLLPLGELTLPSLRWTLRKHHLADDEPTRFLFREFIHSAYRVAQEFERYLEDVDPRLVVVFNGISFPEAVARKVALNRDIRVVTHEIAHRPLTAFFSNEQVTAYRVDIPEDFDLSPEQNKKLDAYLEQRFQGNVAMGGIKFWPEIHALDQGLLDKIEQFNQLVVVFSNVIFDTSQIHANKIFPHMFAWLDQIQGIIRKNPKTLFMIRAHPDEMRPKSNKQSRETVAQWVEQNCIEELPNVVFIRSLEFVSSYALIQHAKFVMAYNSTIALEAVLLGKPVINGGHARYTQYPCVFLPSTPDDHQHMAMDFLAKEDIQVPPAFVNNARRFLYYQVFRTPIPFDPFLKPHPTRGYVEFRDFPAEALQPNKSLALKTITSGLLDGNLFLMPDDLDVMENQL